MTGICNGEYRIRLAAEPSPLFGVDFYPPEVPITAKGQEQIWYIYQIADGNFIISINKGRRIPLFTRDDDGNLVVGEGIIATPWSINGPDGGPYTIQLPGDPHSDAWTVDDAYAPRAPVTLQPLEDDPIPEKQKWLLLRVGDCQN